MNILNKLLDNKKISLFIDDDLCCKKVIIYQFNKLIEYTSELIIINNLLIMGNCLVIKRLEDEEIEIQGQIKEIKFT